jgi:hypothetical protein
MRGSVVRLRGLNALTRGRVVRDGSLEQELLSILGYLSQTTDARRVVREPALIVECVNGKAVVSQSPEAGCVVCPRRTFRASSRPRTVSIP